MIFLRHANFRSLLGFGFIAISLAANADDTAPTGLIPALSGKDAAMWTHLQNYGLNVGGWAAAGINYNTDDPSDRSNGPVSMTDRSREFNLYQLDLFVEKTLVKDKGWDAGGRVDFMFGTDTRYTQATGDWDIGIISQRDERFYTIALPQAYVEV